MITGLFSAGWQVSTQHCKDECIRIPLTNSTLPNVSLQLVVCLDEMPALTTVSLLDRNGNIDREWADKEINVMEITSAAIELNDE
jgi:hypothetical protein